MFNVYKVLPSVLPSNTKSKFLSFCSLDFFESCNENTYGVAVQNERLQALAIVSETQDTVLVTKFAAATHAHAGGNHPLIEVLRFLQQEKPDNAKLMLCQSIVQTQTQMARSDSLELFFNTEWIENVAVNTGEMCWQWAPHTHEQILPRTKALY